MAITKSELEELKKKVNIDQAIEMYLEVKKELQIERLERKKAEKEMQERNAEHFAIKEKEKEVNKLLFDLAQIICPQIIIDKNNNITHSSKAMAQMMRNSYLKEKTEYNEKITKYNKMIMSVKEELSNVKGRLVERQEQDMKRIDDYIEEDKKERYDFSDEELNDELDNFDIDNVYSLGYSGEEDIERVENSLKKIEKDIIVVLGETGVSDLKDLYDTFGEHQRRYGGETKCLQTFEYTHIKNLEDAKVIDMQIAKTFAMKHKIITLNDLGINLYKKLTGKNAVEPVASRIRKDHDNLLHGYSIIDTAKVLESFGYTNISYNRKQNTRPINTQKRAYIPDIVATNIVSGEIEVFEVEMGKHDKSDFETKLDKANLTARVLKIVVDTRMTRIEYENKVIAWKQKRGISLSSAIDIYILTFAELQRKETGVLISRSATNKELMDILNTTNKEESKKLDEIDKEKENENYEINEETGEVITDKDGNSFDDDNSNNNANINILDDLLNQTSITDDDSDDNDDEDSDNDDEDDEGDD